MKDSLPAFLFYAVLPSLLTIVTAYIYSHLTVNPYSGKAALVFAGTFIYSLGICMFIYSIAFIVIGYKYKAFLKNTSKHYALLALLTIVIVPLIFFSGLLSFL